MSTYAHCGIAYSQEGLLERSGELSTSSDDLVGCIDDVDVCCEIFCLCISISGSLFGSLLNRWHIGI